MSHSVGITTGPCKWASAVSTRAKEETAMEKADCDPEKLLQCPYDKNHQIRACRFPYHLIKCRKNHPKLARELKTCPFNARHLVPKDELTHHAAICVDRKAVSADCGDDSDEPCKWQLPVCTWTNPNTFEDWDKDADHFAAPFVWGVSTSATASVQAGSTLQYEPNLTSGLRAPRVYPWPLL